MIHHKNLILFLVFALSLTLHNTYAQTPSNKQLTDDIMDMDRQLFEVAFNKCDLELYEQLVSPELEFYDDRTGLNTDFSKEIAAFKDRCSKSYSVTRKLVKATVSKLGDYGALEIGEHDFYIDDTRVETAKFIIIWERTTDGYIMKRTVSFEHRPFGN